MIMSVTAGTELSSSRRRGVLDPLLGWWTLFSGGYVMGDGAMLVVTASQVTVSIHGTPKPITSTPVLVRVCGVTRLIPTMLAIVRTLGLPTPLTVVRFSRAP